MKFHLFLSIISLFFLTACSYISLQEDNEKVNNLIQIAGHIEFKDGPNSAAIIHLLKVDDIHLVDVSRKVKKESGSFTFHTETGTYKIFAYVDTNDNQKYEDTEVIVSSGLLCLTKSDKLVRVNLIIDKLGTKDLLNEVRDIKNKAFNKLNLAELKIGETISLNSPIFSQENVSKGLWEPYAFMQEVPFGLFLLKKYDPNKKVVLFVHGINGSPQNFTKLINSLDNSRFQAMVIYYPSGLRLHQVSTGLYSLVEELEVRLGFKHISIIAHSMGGLVSRDYINSLTKNKDSLVDSFISISTPWSGHASAGLGVKYSHVIIPVWKDMDPKSTFIKELVKPSLPKTTPHYLLFGVNSGDISLGENTDGVVSIASQIRLPIQEGTSLFRGFNEGHMSILENEDVIKLINKLLKANL